MTCQLTSGWRRKKVSSPVSERPLTNCTTPTFMPWPMAQAARQRRRWTCPAVAGVHQQQAAVSVAAAMAASTTAFLRSMRACGGRCVLRRWTLRSGRLRHGFSRGWLLTGSDRHNEQGVFAIGDGPQGVAEGGGQTPSGEHLGRRARSRGRPRRLSSSTANSVAGGEVDVMEDHHHSRTTAAGQAAK